MDITAMRRNRLVATALLICLPWTAANAACLGMQVHAHRGAPGLIENSVPAIRAAHGGSWDGVEIDMQQLKDGRWVLHHDPVPGRTVGGVARRPVAQLSSADWQSAKMVGNGGGSAPPFLDDAMREAASRPDKTFNAELKIVYQSCEPVRKLVADMKQTLGHGNWMVTSGFPEALRCVRNADPAGYLGLIVFDPRNAEAAGANVFTQQVAKRGRAPVLSQQWLKNLVDIVGAPVGVHLDALTLAANPDLLQNAAALSIPVFVYSVAGDDRLARQLRSSNEASGYMPSGVIIDGDPEKFCKAVGGF